MSQLDLEINRETRKVMIRHWIDLGRISIRSTNGRLTVTGFLDRIQGKQERLNSLLVEIIFSEIKRIRDVRMVSPQLDNWTNSNGVWQEITHERTTPSNLRDFSAKSFNIPGGDGNT